MKGNILGLEYASPQEVLVLTATREGYEFNLISTCYGPDDTEIYICTIKRGELEVHLVEAVAKLCIANPEALAEATKLHASIGEIIKLYSELEEQKQKLEEARRKFVAAVSR